MVLTAAVSSVVAAEASLVQVMSAEGLREGAQLVSGMW